MASRSPNVRSRSRRPHHGETVIDLRDGAAAEPRRRLSRTGPRRVAPSDLEKRDQLRQSRFFGSPAFRRLWFSQVLSSLGDWIGLIAITAIANRVGAGDGSAATALVLAARLVPGFFFSPIAGVLLDRWNRKTVMVVCDFGRATVLCTLPFVQNLPSLIVASLLLELFTLMWSPAKEASVPNMVRPEFLPTANSLSIAAAYGTIPVASLLFALLAKIPDWVGRSDTLSALHLTNESIALYFDALTYLVSAATIATLAIRHHAHQEVRREPDQSRTAAGMSEAREGLAYIRDNARVRSVIVGLAAGLVGGGMIVPLGSAFATDVLKAGSSGYGLLLTGMGAGVAIGVTGLMLFQRRLPIGQDRIFVLATFGAGVSLLVSASMNGLGAAVLSVGFLGLFAGSAYVSGYSSVQVHTVDEVRGRVFAALYTVTRVCIVVGLIGGPVGTKLFGSLSEWAFDGDIQVLGARLILPGVRITLWLGGAIIVLASLLAARSLRRPNRRQVPGA